MAVGQDGALYILGWRRVRRVGTNGVIRTIAGGRGQPGFAGDGGLATAALYGNLGSMAIAPDDSVYFPDYTNQNVRRIQPRSTGLAPGEQLLVGGGGAEVYVVSAQGRHLRTLHGLTGGLIHSFDYDADGYLASITSRGGLVTSIERQGGLPTAMSPPAASAPC